MGFRQTKSSQKRQHQQHHSTEISKCSKSRLTCLFIQTCQTLFTFLKKYSFRDYQNIFKGKEAVPYQKFDTSTSQLGFRCQYTWGMQFFLGYYLSWIYNWFPLQDWSYLNLHGVTRVFMRCPWWGVICYMCWKAPASKTFELLNILPCVGHNTLSSQ